MLERGDDEAIIRYVAEAGFVGLAATLKEAQIEARQALDLGQPKLDFEWRDDPVARHVALELLRQLSAIQDLHRGLMDQSATLVAETLRAPGFTTRREKQDLGIPELPKELGDLQQALAESLGVRLG